MDLSTRSVLWVIFCRVMTFNPSQAQFMVITQQYVEIFKGVFVGNHNFLMMDLLLLGFFS